MEKKTFRKPMIIAAMVLMVALVVGMGAMTYSRYVTTTDLSSQQATVAQWGYVVTASSGEMFGTDYTKANDATYSTVVADNGVAVVAASGNAVVAPGCSGRMVISVTGTSDVRAQLEFVVDTASSKDISVLVDDVAYNPIKWSFYHGSTALVTDVTLAQLNSEIAALDPQLLAPGTETDEEYVISWKWDLTGGNDGADTALGLSKAGKAYDTEKYTELKTELALALSVTVKQVQ